IMAISIISPFSRQHTADEVSDGVDLAVRPGHTVCIIGPSGSGKSTLLACAGTLLPPTSGEVVIDGDFVSDRPAKDLAALRRRLVGFVFQDFNLIPSLTAVENVA
ncbi:ATP-binding cassette domain-containing protein, partial [Bacillus sp. S34]|nr:ATP-binding cassette domain-containing protein [Bacillus sp. S34]